MYLQHHHVCVLTRIGTTPHAPAPLPACAAHEKHSLTETVESVSHPDASDTCLTETVKRVRHPDATDTCLTKTV